jgi:hypothetical protein
LILTFQKGVPQSILKFITERGLTIEQIAADTNLATYVLEQIEKEGLLKDSMKMER